MAEEQNKTKNINIGSEVPDPKALSAPDGTLQPGQVLQSRYRILGIIGMGGMGAVYQARDLRFDVTRLCAVKEMINMAKEQNLREQTMKNFKREAEILATLDHPSIPKIYDYFGFGDRAYLVQEFIQGEDLEAMLNGTKEFLDPEQIRKWAVEVCDVLNYLHNYTPDPIIFRDMKPSNIMIDQRRSVRLIDFGIAKTFQMGQQGTMIGTEGYSPPEQYRGIATPAADIYALGATMHHLLTRRDPRTHPPFSFQEAPIQDFNPNVSEALANVVMRALNYNTDERYSTAEAMKQSLIAAGDDESSVQQAPTMQAPPQQPNPQMPQQPPGQQMPPAGYAPIPPGYVPQGYVPPGYVPAPMQPMPQKPAGPVAPVRRPIWSFKVEDAVRSTPLAIDGIVFVGSYDNNVWAINATDGSLRWKYATDDGIGSSPAFANGLILIGSTDKKLHAVEARTGKPRWRYQTDGKIYTTPKVSAGVAYFGADDGKIYAIRPKSSTATLEWEFNAMSKIRSSPMVDSAEEIVVFGTEVGEVIALDLAGELKWRFTTRRRVLSSPALHDSVVYVGSDDWNLHALEAAGGYPAWRFKTKGLVVSSPVVSRGKVYFGSADKTLYCVDTLTGKETWRFETSGAITSSPAIEGDFIYIADTSGTLYCFDVHSGEPIWVFKSPKPILSSPHVSNGVVYIGTDNKNIHAFQAT